MELKELGISVFFEKENLDSMAAGTDLVLSILSSMAEQESRDMSTNIKWTFRTKFARGDMMLNYSRFLGYTKDENNNLVIVPEEAAVVRRIYNEFLSGKTCPQIARHLMDDHILTPDGKEYWWSSTVLSILHNEKYCGDALLQKSFSVDFLSKRQENMGQVEQYRVTDSHPAIVSRETWNLVKAEFERRASIRSTNASGRGRYASRYPFSGLIVCGQCGSKYRRHCQWNRDEKVPIWVCNSKQLSRNELCQALPIKEVVLEQAFVECLRRVIADREEFVDTLQANIDECISDEPLENIEALDRQINEQQQLLIELNRQFRCAAIRRDEYSQKYDGYAQTLENLMGQRDAVKNKNELNKLAETRMTEMRDFLEGIKTLKTFNGEVMRDLIEEIRIDGKHEAVFSFKCGLEYTMSI